VGLNFILFVFVVVRKRLAIVGWIHDRKRKIEMLKRKYGLRSEPRLNFHVGRSISSERLARASKPFIS
jgi:hypothetical protein